MIVREKSKLLNTAIIYLVRPGKKQTDSEEASKKERSSSYENELRGALAAEMEVGRGSKNSGLLTIM